MPLSREVTDQIAAGREVFAPLVQILRGEPAERTMEEARADYIKVKARQPAPEGVDFHAIDMGGLPGALATPADASDRVIFYIHGGGYVSGGSGASHAEVGRLALAARARVYVPDYRLAPEHPFPTPIDDVFSAYTWMLESGVPASRIAFAGESAGGAMVVSIMVRARNAGLALPIAGVAISPWANLEHTGATMNTRDGRDPVVTKAALQLFARRFLGDALPGNPEASPVFADVGGLPPILVQVGENEVMLSDAMRLAQHLALHRVRTTLEVWPGMFHVWHHFAAILPEARAAIANAAAFLGQAFDEAGVDA